MDELKMDAELAAKLNGKKVRLTDERGRFVGYYVPALEYIRLLGAGAGIPPEPPTEEEVAAVFAEPRDPSAYRPWEELSAEMRRGR